MIVVRSGTWETSKTYLKKTQTVVIQRNCKATGEARDPTGTLKPRTAIFEGKRTDRGLLIAILPRNATRSRLLEWDSSRG
jgi:hypothetical protein